MPIWAKSSRLMGLGGTRDGTALAGSCGRAFWGFRDLLGPCLSPRGFGGRSTCASSGADLPKTVASTVDKPQASKSEKEAIRTTSQLKSSLRERQRLLVTTARNSAPPPVANIR